MNNITWQSMWEALVSAPPEMGLFVGIVASFFLAVALIQGARAKRLKRELDKLSNGDRENK